MASARSCGLPQRELGAGTGEQLEVQVGQNVRVEAKVEWVEQVVGQGDA